MCTYNEIMMYYLNLGKFFFLEYVQLEANEIYFNIHINNSKVSYSLNSHNTKKFYYILDVICFKNNLYCNITY